MIIGMQCVYMSFQPQLDLVSVAAGVCQEPRGGDAAGVYYDRSQ